MNFVSYDNIVSIFNGIAPKIGGGITDWVASTSYSVGTIVIYNNTLYKCTTANSDATFNSAKWQSLGGGGNGFTEWAANTSYSVGDIIVYEGQLYRVTTAFTSSSTFDDTNLEEYIPYSLTAAQLQALLAAFNPGPVVVSTAIPGLYAREDIPAVTQTTITIKPTALNINGNGYNTALDTIIDINDSNSWAESTYATAANRAGKDFYIYVCEPASGTTPDFILSGNSTIPTGYTASNSRKIGGFHCLCASVGTISGHTLSGYVTGDILPRSIWDLNHRAISDNEGMIWIPEIGLWVDIYLGSWDGSKIVSEYNGVPITGESATPMHGLLLAENYGLVNKILPSFDEFMVFAKGSPEGTNIFGSTAPAGAGGHVDTNSQRIISNYGLEDCTGVILQWSRDHAENYLDAGGNATTYRGSYYTSGRQWLSGYDWNDVSVYNSTLDSVQRGSAYGPIRRFVFGGAWANSSDCGSRSVSADAFGSIVGSDCAGRGLSRKR